MALGSSPVATGQLEGSRSTPSGSVDISNVFFVYRSSQGNSFEFVDKTATNAGKSSDFGSKIGLRYRSVDGSASELIFAAPAGNGGTSFSSGFMMEPIHSAEGSSDSAITNLDVSTNPLMTNGLLWVSEKKNGNFNWSSAGVFPGLTCGSASSVGITPVRARG